MVTNFPIDGIKISISCCELTCNEASKYMNKLIFVDKCDVYAWPCLIAALAR